MKVCYQIQVKGEVQGVYFRASSQQVAIEHCLGGYAHNLDNGNVEVLVCGEEQDVKAMIEWLKHGPDTAKVESCEVNQVKWRDFNHFSIG